MHETLGTRLEFSTTFHPQTYGQTERVNQILEDMLRACALDYGSSWDDNFLYAEFSYNNSYQASLKMAPFEALYGRRCRTPLLWDEVGDRQLFGPDLIKESEEKVKLIRDRLKVAQSRQKSYVDSQRILNARRQSMKSETECIFVCPHFEELSVLELRES